MKSIKVYGPGCAKCENLAALTKQVIEELGIQANIEKVTDVMQFAVAGVIVTPALEIDGKIVLMGRVPSKEELIVILQREINKDAVQDDAKLPGAEVEQSPCGCAPGKCCGPRNSSSWLKIVIWAVVIIAALAAIKFANRTARDADVNENTPTAIQQQ